MKRRHALGLLLLAAAAGSGCGFRLRESSGLPFETLYTTFPRTSALGSEFRRVVRSSSGTRIIDERDQAEAILVVLAENRQKEAIGFSTTGRPVEYELRLRTAFRVDDPAGHNLLRPTVLVVRREISVGEIQLLSKQLEEEQIFREMQSDMVQQMVRRLATITPRQSQ
ncbi:MAG: LPS assembly lipoprotein LptE [Burkholderiaceae bacterium]